MNGLQEIKKKFQYLARNVNLLIGIKKEKMQFKKNCEKCKKEFICYYEKSRFCSNICKKEKEGLKKFICPVCKKEFQPRWHGQIHCNIDCYAKSEKLKDEAKNSLLIKYNGVAKWREGTISKKFNNVGQFKKGIKPWNYNKDKEFLDLLIKIRKSKRCLEWKKKILERDNEIENSLHVHHLIPFRELIIKYQITTPEEAEKCKELWDTNLGVTITKGEHQIITNMERINKFTKGFIKSINKILQEK